MRPRTISTKSHQEKIADASRKIAGIAKVILILENM